jgi:hypothetical protein
MAGLAADDGRVGAEIDPRSQILKPRLRRLGTVVMSAHIFRP